MELGACFRRSTVCLIRDEAAAGLIEVEVWELPAAGFGTLAPLIIAKWEGQYDEESNVAFLHTGDVANLFEVPGVVGDTSMDMRD